MAESDIQIFRDELPDAFDDKKPPSRWDEYHIVPVDIEGGRGKAQDYNPIEQALVDYLKEEPQQAYQQSETLNRIDRPDPRDAFTDYVGGTGLSVETSFPGGPMQHEQAGFPPPDAFAFYLPFHYYHPALWGVYLIAEGVLWLAIQLRKHSGWDAERSDWKLSAKKAIVGAQLFLYHHEAFHHKTESFATRLEVSHRQTLYRIGFQELFDSTFLTKECLEEALANGYAYRRVKEAFKKRDPDTDKVLSGLRTYIEGQPPGYNRGMEFANSEDFNQGRYRFSEDNHEKALSHLVAKAAGIWGMFGYAFSGIASINSYTNYIVRAGSPLMDRADLHGRYIGYRELKKRLKELVGLQFKRQGKGSHEIYRTEDGKSVTLYYDNGDVPKGTLSSILKQAGVNMSVHDFLRS